VGFEFDRIREAHRDIAADPTRTRRVEAIRRWEHRYCARPCTSLRGVCPARGPELHLVRPTWAYELHSSPEEYARGVAVAAERARVALAQMEPPPKLPASEPNGSTPTPPYHGPFEAEADPEPTETETGASVLFGDIAADLDDERGGTIDDDDIGY
jgi:hypothetical protein